LNTAAPERPASGIDLQTLQERHLTKWMFAQPDLIDQVVDGLRKAGLE